MNGWASNPWHIWEIIWAITRVIPMHCCCTGQTLFICWSASGRRLLTSAEPVAMLLQHIIPHWDQIILLHHWKMACWSLCCHFWSQVDCWWQKSKWSLSKLQWLVKRKQKYSQICLEGSVLSIHTMSKESEETWVRIQSTFSWSKWGLNSNKFPKMRSGLC